MHISHTIILYINDALSYIVYKFQKISMPPSPQSDAEGTGISRGRGGRGKGQEEFLGRYIRGLRKKSLLWEYGYFNP